MIPPSNKPYFTHTFGKNFKKQSDECAPQSLSKHFEKQAKDPACRICKHTIGQHTKLVQRENNGVQPSRACFRFAEHEGEVYELCYLCSHTWEEHALLEWKYANGTTLYYRACWFSAIDRNSGMPLPFPNDTQAALVEHTQGLPPALCTCNTEGQCLYCFKTWDQHIPCSYPDVYPNFKYCPPQLVSPLALRVAEPAFWEQTHQNAEPHHNFWYP
ncbi:hypothetical protein T439DRAFT_325953 [Meredithblackwellia eburnea MCA 4105]